MAGVGQDVLVGVLELVKGVLSGIFWFQGTFVKSSDNSCQKITVLGVQSRTSPSNYFFYRLIYQFLLRLID